MSIFKIVILPSAFSGGAMVIEHHDEQVAFRAAGGKLTFIAFYADCHHQVRPVTAGYRVVLAYNLMVDGDMPRTIGSAAAGHLDALAQSIERFFETPLPRRWHTNRDGSRRTGSCISWTISTRDGVSPGIDSRTAMPFGLRCCVGPATGL